MQAKKQTFYLKRRLNFDRRTISIFSNIKSLLFCLVFISTIVMSCSNPRDEFSNDIYLKYDTLINELHNYNSGTKMSDAEDTKATEWVNGEEVSGTSNEGFPFARSGWVISYAKKLRETFRTVDELFLDQDLDDFKEWSEGFKKQLEARRQLAIVEIDRIKKLYKKNPEDFWYSPFGVRNSQTLSIRDDQLIFWDNGDGYIIEKFLDLDLDTWLHKLELESIKYQNNSKTVTR